MKKLLIITIAAAVVTMAQHSGLRERVFRVKSSPDLKGSTVRVTSGRLYLDRNAVIPYEVIGTNGLPITRGSITLDRPALREWMNSSEPVQWLRTNILNSVQLDSNE